MDFLAKNEEETAKMAADFATRLGPNDDRAQVVGLYGDLGAGKTTFMKYLAKSLGIKETIQSPTFVIMKIYNTSPNGVFEHLIHIDAYRIENDQEMVTLGWQEIISNPKNLVFVEWPERIKSIMPPHTKIFFEHISERERNIRIESWER